LMRENDVSEAIAVYERLVALEPADIEARTNLGVAYARQGRLDSAVRQWEAVLKIDPDNANARQNIEKATKLQRRSGD